MELTKIIRQIRMLSAETIEKASSGHPGLPLGAAPMACALFHELMKYDPKNPHWPDRDRFVLSAGHGSALMYSMLHLYGYEISMEDIKSFRQLGSRTPGHPELWCVPGVETATGPLGAGFSNAVGMAVAEKHMNALFGKDIIDHRTWVLASDGDMQEGISNEAAQFAATMGLSKLCVLYDSNKISIEGNTDVTFTEDTAGRFKALGWYTDVVNGEDPQEVITAVKNAFEKDSARPKLIVCRTVIARDAEEKEGTAGAHGSPLGKAVLEKMRAKYGFSGDFYIDPEVTKIIAEKRSTIGDVYGEWNERFEAMKASNAEKAALWDAMQIPTFENIEWPVWEAGKKEASRKSSGIVLNAIAKACPSLMGGSADLAPSNNTWLSGLGTFSNTDGSGRNIHFGIREHAMAGIVNGMAQHGFHIPFGATFLVFSDYMRGALRLSALMKLRVLWILTHDSFHVGEDGPTHQPVEHIDSLRLIPGMKVIRPADGNETVAAYEYALNHHGPVCLALTRQDLLQLANSSRNRKDLRGYTVKNPAKYNIQIFASGSEVALALEAAEILGKTGKEAMVVSVPLLDLESDHLTKLVNPSPDVLKVAIEAGTARLYTAFGINNRIGMESFGESGKANELAEHFGFTGQKIADRLLEMLEK